MFERDDVRKKISQFVDVISKRFDIEQVLLFGSHVKECSNMFSDIDLAIISKDFTEKTHLDVLKFLWITASRIDSRIEPMPFSLAEFRNADPRSLIGEIRKTGKVIYKN